MWHQHDAGLDRLGGDLPDWDGDSFARVARAPRERPSRPTADGTEILPSQYLSGDPNVPDANEYNVQINFQGTWSADLRQAFMSAADAISNFILGDIPSSGARRSAVDDLVITASLKHRRRRRHPGTGRSRRGARRQLPSVPRQHGIR